MKYIYTVNKKRYINIGSVLNFINNFETIEEYKKKETRFISNYKKRNKRNKKNIIKIVDKNNRIYKELEKDFLNYFKQEKTSKTRKLHYFFIREKDIWNVMGSILHGASTGSVEKKIKDGFNYITSNTGKVYSKDEDKYKNNKIKRIYEISEYIYKELTGEEKPAKEIIEMGNSKANRLSTLMDLVYPLYEKVYRDCVEDIAIKMPLLYGDNVLKSSFYRFFTLGIVKEDKELSKYSVKDYEVLKKHLESYVNKLGYKFTDDKKLLTIPKEEQKYKTWYYNIEKELANNIIIELLDINLYNMKKDDIKNYINFMIEKDILVSERIDKRDKILLPREYLDLLNEDLKKNNINSRYAYTNRKIKDKEYFELVESTIDQSYLPNIITSSNLIDNVRNIWEDKHKFKNMLIDEIDDYYSLLYKKNYLELCLNKGNLYDKEFFLLKEMYKIDKETTKDFIQLRKEDMWNELRQINNEIKLKISFLVSINKNQIKEDKLYHNNSLLAKLYA